VTCTTCAREIPDGEVWRLHCKTPAEFSAKEFERMKVDVRARVLWADPVESIREDWLKKGAPPTAVDIALRESIHERHRHFRLRGFQDLGMGILCLLLGGAAYLLQLASVHGEIRLGGRGTACMMIASVVAPLAGLLLTLRGIRRIATGGREEKQASDLSEFE
jgi:hypothetical protein